MVAVTDGPWNWDQPSTLTTPAPTDFERDRWGRPLIVGLDGKVRPYVRASAAAKTVEDTYNLEMWARRNVVFGMARDASLAARVLAVGGDPSTWTPDERKAVNKIHEDAAAVALAHKAADIGTAVHRLTEMADRGLQPVTGPYEADVNAYVDALIGAGLSTVPAYVECRLVCDTLAMAGTADRLLRRADGSWVVGDIKTGSSVDYGALGWAAQLAAYAHGSLYDVATGARVETPPLDRTVGIIIHLPAGSGTCTLYELDLVAGFRAAQLANEIRQVRREARRWIAPHTATQTPVEPSRRDVLRDRYRQLDETTQAAFRARGIAADDLDAIEAALDDITRPRPTRFVGDEGGDVDAGAVEQLLKMFKALDDIQRARLEGVAREAHDTVGTFNIRVRPTRRRYDIYRALLLWTRLGWDADLVRAGLAMVTGDAACQQPGIPLGAVVGMLTTEQATAFADMAAAVDAGGYRVDFSTGVAAFVAV